MFGNEIAGQLGNAIADLGAPSAISNKGKQFTSVNLS